MADQNRDLPEGTDQIITGASAPTSDAGAVGLGAGSSDDEGDVLIVAEVDVEETPVSPNTTGAASSRGPGSGGGSGSTGGSGVQGAMNLLRSGGQKLTGQASDKARGLVGQGLERSADALANVSRLIGETAPGLDERLGPDFGDYARRAADAIEDAANAIASKDPEELIDDTRNFVRKTPGVALAGAAIVGFALARFVKTGLAARDEDDSGDTGSRGTTER